MGIFRGLATTRTVRGQYGLDGLLPSGGNCTPEVEVARAEAAVAQACSPLQQYQVSSAWRW